MKVMEGHTSLVLCLSFSPNGQLIVSGSYDNTLRLWSSLDQENPTMKVMEGHTKSVTCLSFSPNGQSIVSGSDDHTLRLWSSLDQEKPTMKVMEGHTSSVNCLSFSPNGQSIVSGSEDNTLRLWSSLDQEKPIMKVMKGHTSLVLCLSFSPNGQSIVSGSADNTLRLWNVELGIPLFTFPLLFSACSLSWDKYGFIVGRVDGALMLWDICSVMMIDDNGKRIDSIEPILKWKRGGSSVLSSFEASICDSKQLSYMNRDLLEQNGAKSIFRQIKISPLAT
jgi:WD40 repeat protein